MPEWFAKLAFAAFLTDTQKYTCTAQKKCGELLEQKKRKKNNFILKYASQMEWKWKQKTGWCFCLKKSKKSTLTNWKCEIIRLRMEMNRNEGKKVHTHSHIHRSQWSKAVSRV